MWNELLRAACQSRALLARTHFRTALLHLRVTLVLHGQQSDTQLCLPGDSTGLALHAIYVISKQRPNEPQDPSLWCVSSWNDHGQKSFVSDPTRLLRSDFFPGLGWMLRRDIWDSIKGDWRVPFVHLQQRSCRTTLVQCKYLCIVMSAPASYQAMRWCLNIAPSAVRQSGITDIGLRLTSTLACYQRGLPILHAFIAQACGVLGRLDATGENSPWAGLRAS